MLRFFDILKSTELFKDLTDETITALFTLDSYKIREYKKNSVIYFQNEKCETIDIVLKGVVSIEGIDEKGSSISINDFIVGSSIGGNLLFSRNNFYPMTILAKTDATVIHINKELILKLCKDNTEFLINLLGSLSDNALILAQKIKTLSLKSLRQSIIEYLIYESYVQNTNRINLSLTKKELAEKFGVQRTSLSRELNKMKMAGVIEYDAHSITILDEESIRRY